MPFNKKTYEKNQAKIRHLFTLKGATCLGQVRGENWGERGFLFMMEGHLIFLSAGGYSMGFEKKDSLVRFSNRQNAVFFKISKTRYFEEHGSYWTIHNEGKVDE